MKCMETDCGKKKMEQDYVRITLDHRQNAKLVDHGRLSSLPASN